MTFKVKEGIRINGQNFVNDELDVLAKTVELTGGVASTSTTTGSLIVDGGAGLTGDLYLGGTLSVGTGFTVNGISGDLTVNGNLTVNGTTTTLNTAELTVDDKNIILASIASPTDVTADGGGITLKGTTDKSFLWLDNTDSWTSSEHIDLASTKTFKIANNEVLSASTLFNSQTTVDIAPGASTIVVGVDNSGILTLRNSTVAVSYSLTVGSSASITGNLSVNTDKFIVTATSGDVTVAGNLNADGNLTGNILISEVPDGTSPLTVTSTTLVANLNADYVDGFQASVDNIVDTIAVRDASGDINLSNAILHGSTSGTTILQPTATASGILTLPSATDTLVGRNTSDTITNKTINLTNNALSGTISQFNTALSDADFATLAGNETLTNKTLTNPTINAGSGTLVLPQGASPAQTSEGSIFWDTDDELLSVGTGSGRKTLVDLDSTQTLTNKTLSAPIFTGISQDYALTGDVTGSVTVTNFGSVSISTTIAANSVALGTDTTGNYVATISGTTNQITVTGSGSETADITLSLPQDINTSSSPTFAGATLDNIRIGITGTNEIDTSTGNLTIDSAGGTVTVDDNLIISGNLTVNGTTTTVNSTTITIDDPIFTLGGDQLPTSNDSKDRGIEFRWHNGTDAKLGFFGYDDSSGKFTFIPDAANASEVFTGTKGIIDANIEWSDILNKPDPTLTIDGDASGTATFTDLGNATLTLTIADDSHNHVVSNIDNFTEEVQDVVGGMVDSNTESGIAVIYDDANGKLNFDVSDFTITLTGDVTGTGTVTNLGNVSFSTTIAADSVALGTDTTGNYVASVATGTGLTGGAAGSEGAGLTLSLSHLGIESLADPNADRILFWDDSANATAWMTISTGLSLTGTTLVNSDRGSSQSIFKNIAVSGQSSIVADNNDDTLTVAAGTGITITTDANTDTLTITHANTSDVSNLSSDNSGSTFIQDISFTFDEFGHVTAASVATANALTSQASDFGTVTVTDTDSGYTWTSTGSAVADAVSDTLTIVSGSAINVDVDATSDAIRIAHADTSSVSNLSSDNSGSTFIQDISFTFDDFGHVTAASVATANALTSQANDFGTVAIGADSGYTWGAANTNTNQVADTTSDTLTLVNGGGINLFTNTVAGTDAIKIEHADTSTQASVDNSNGTVVQDITLDEYGHITNIGSIDLDGRYYTETESDTRFLRKDADDTATGNITISKTAPILKLLDTNTTNSEFPTIEFETSNNQGIKIYHDEFDANLPVAGYGLIVAPSTNNAGGSTLTLNVLGEIYAGATATGGLHRVWHSGTVTQGDGITITDTNGAITIAHTDTSTVSNVSSSSSGNTFIQGLTLNFDTFGHVTSATATTGTVSGFATNAFSTITVSDTDSGYTWGETGSAAADSTADTVTLVSGAGVNVDVDATNDAIRITNTDRGSSQNIFKNIAVAGQSTVVADSNDDTLTLVAGANITITTNASNDSITIAATGGGETSTPTLQVVTTQGNTTDTTISITNTTASTSTTTGALVVSGGVGIGGALNAVSKSFDISHPTKTGMRLRHGSLEGPEFGVYVRGRLTASTVINLPDYWTGLIDESTISVTLTPVGSYQSLYVTSFNAENVNIAVDNKPNSDIDCFYTIWAERKDIDKLQVES